MYYIKFFLFLIIFALISNIKSDNISFLKYFGQVFEDQEESVENFKIQNEDNNDIKIIEILYHCSKNLYFKGLKQHNIEYFKFIATDLSQSIHAIPPNSV